MADFRFYPPGDYINGTSQNDKITTLYHNNLPHRFINGHGGDDLMIINSWSFSRDHPIYWHLPESESGDRIHGGAGNDTIYGSEGENNIFGGIGDDLIYAGTPVYEPPFDTPFFEREVDDIVRAGAGNDKVYGQGGHDKLFGDDGNDLIDGGADNDTLRGGLDADTLEGGSGNDMLFGGDGRDSLLGGLGNDQLRGDAGNDFLNGGTGADTLEGGSGNDALLGGLGNDRMMGGFGKDQMTGGMGADHFVFTNRLDSGAGPVGRDVITDFNRAQGDKINLSALDANLRLSGNQAFEFVGTDGFSGSAGELRYQQSNGTTLVFADSDGDRRADFSIELSRQVTLHENDFFL